MTDDPTPYCVEGCGRPATTSRPMGVTADGTPTDELVCDAHCDCGAKRELVEITRLGDLEPSYVPGALLEPCTCPHCPFCNRRLDAEQRCDNLDCRYCGLIIPEPR